MRNASSLVRASLSEQIRDMLLNRIATGELRPGDRLVELKIAAEMQTSQAPVREALRELETMGLVETARNRGARVRVISEQELGEILDVRGQLEGYAAALAASKGGDVPREMTDGLEKMRRASKNDDKHSYVEGFDDFHQALVKSAGNAVLYDEWWRLSVKVRPLLAAVHFREDMRDRLTKHERIAQAFETHDGDAAQAATIAHAQELKAKACARLLEQQAETTLDGPRVVAAESGHSQT